MSEIRPCRHMAHHGHARARQCAWRHNEVLTPAPCNLVIETRSETSRACRNPTGPGLARSLDLPHVPKGRRTHLRDRLDILRYSRFTSRSSTSGLPRASPVFPRRPCTIAREARASQLRSIQPRWWSRTAGRRSSGRNAGLGPSGTGWTATGRMRHAFGTPVMPGEKKR